MAASEVPIYVYIIEFQDHKYRRSDRESLHQTRKPFRQIYFYTISTLVPLDDSIYEVYGITLAEVQRTWHESRQQMRTGDV